MSRADALQELYRQHVLSLVEAAEGIGDGRLAAKVLALSVDPTKFIKQFPLFVGAPKEKP